VADEFMRWDKGDELFAHLHEIEIDADELNALRRCVCGQATFFEDGTCVYCRCKRRVTGDGE
jgi:hypothetical protein